jgi:hypothetical protein
MPEAFPHRRNTVSPSGAELADAFGRESRTLRTATAHN